MGSIDTLDDMTLIPQTSGPAVAIRLYTEVELIEYVLPPILV